MGFLSKSGWSLWYAFTLLVIYFLQAHLDVQLPVLPVEAFEDLTQHDADERAIMATARHVGFQSLLIGD